MTKFLVCLLLLAGAALPAAFAQTGNLTPRLVKEIQGDSSYQNQSNFCPQFLTTVGNTLYYFTTTPGSGMELWKTDGTGTGTLMPRDIAPGPADASYNTWNRLVGTLKGQVYFCAANRLWKTDGTTAGTTQVKDLAVTPNESDFMNNYKDCTSAVQYGTLYFFADDGQHGAELWKTDGTDAGTIMVRDLAAGAAGLDGSLGPEDLQIVAYKTILLFSGTDDAGGLKLWKSDGTAAGTRLLKDVSLGARSKISFEAQTWNRVFFTVWSGTDTEQFWVTDGTVGGTLLLYTFTKAAGNLVRSGSFTAFGNKVFFPSGTQGLGAELWATDGTPEGTGTFMDLVPGAASSWPRQLTVFNGALYFFAYDPAHGQELWKSDGTTSGTTLLKDTNPGPADGAYYDTFLREAGGRLYFSARGSNGNTALWKSDGTTSGTVEIPLSTLPANMTSLRLLGAAGSSLVFMVLQGNLDPHELWLSDGTSTGTRQITHTIARVYDPGIGEMVALGDRVIFPADDSLHHYQFWKSDGTTSGTAFVPQENPSYTEYGYRNLTRIGSRIYYLDYTYGMSRLFTTDGTTAGTRQVLPPNAGSSTLWHCSKPVAFQGEAWFTNFVGPGCEFWKTDGTTTGTQKAFSRSMWFSGAPDLVASGGCLYYMAVFSSTVFGDSLWVTDGQSTPTTARSINSQGVYTWRAALLNSHQLTDVNGTLFFVADDRTHGNELWKCQGPTTNPVLVRDINPGTTGTAIANLTNVNGKLFFTASEPGSGNEPWVSDGTTSGTRLVKDIVPGAAGSNPANLFNVNGALFFTADLPGAGRELWRSDGTPEETMLVADINPGPESSTPDFFANAGGYLYFSAYEPAHGFELWRSDGTAAGTWRISDISPGPLSSNPEQLTVAGRYLFFTAIDGTTSQGQELWAIDVGPVTGVKDWRLYGE